MSQASEDTQFVLDMEQGGYAPDATNALKRLNDVTRKWESRLQGVVPTPTTPPQLIRQNAENPCCYGSGTGASGRT